MVLGVAYLEILITICLIVLPVYVLPLKWSAPIKVDSLDIYLRLIGIYAVVFLASSVKLLKHWYTMQKKNQQLIKEKLEAELNMLKSQVHPHFLFNTLNNLYALTLKKSDKSPDVVLKLSEILDFMLYHSNKDFVELEREIKLINNYIALEKLRYGERLIIDFEIDGEIQNKNIAPMLIFPLVENCFKHGVSSTNQKSWIKLTIKVSTEHLSFTAENSMIEKQDKQKGGLGLINLRKRLNLIYPENHKLIIDETGGVFTALLEISLSV
jgi:LytS/YehU family sensor histidine kinase